MCTKFGIWYTNLIWHHIPEPITSENKKLHMTIYFKIMTLSFQLSKPPPIVIKCTNDVKYHITGVLLYSPHAMDEIQIL